MPKEREEPSTALNINLVIARKKCGMTQTDVVDALRKRGYYITHMGYAGLEKRGKLFRLEFIKLLAEIFGVSPVFFFEKRSAIWDAAQVVKQAKEESHVGPTLP